MKMCNVQEQNVYIIADGIANFNKIVQQRDRRFRSAICENKTSGIFDSNQISPHTPFMNMLEKALQTSFKKSIVDFEKDESEHKIMRYIKQDNEDSEQLIYGLDSDLIQLSLLCQKDIILIRNNIEDEQNNIFDFLQISTLKNCILQDLKIDKSVNSQEIINDWVFLTFLLGNDFVNKIPWLALSCQGQANGLSIITKAYKYTKAKFLQYPIIDPVTFKIHLQFFKDILTNIAGQMNKITKTTNYIHVENQNPDWIVYNKDYVKATLGNYNIRYYTYHGILKKNLNDLNSQYISTLVWIYTYYQLNESPNYLVKQNFQGEPAPLIQDLCHFNEKHYTNYNGFVKNVELTSEQQLDLILPKKNVKYQLILDAFDCSQLWQSKLVSIQKSE